MSSKQPDPSAARAPGPSRVPLRPVENPIRIEELPPPDTNDPVIEVYKKDVDRTLLRENLKLTVEERLSKLARAVRYAEELREAGRRARERDVQT